MVMQGYGYGGPGVLTRKGKGGSGVLTRTELRRCAMNDIKPVGNGIKSDQWKREKLMPLIENARTKQTCDTKRRTCQTALKRIEGQSD
jgi:hypothetical protein